MTTATKEMLVGRRKYRAFLFSLAVLALLTAGGMLTSQDFTRCLAWLFGLLGVTNGMEHAAEAYTKRGET